MYGCPLRPDVSRHCLSWSITIASYNPAKSRILGIQIEILLELRVPCLMSFGIMSCPNNKSMRPGKLNEGLARVSP